MKNLTLLFAAGLLLTFSACSNDPAGYQDTADTVNSRNILEGDTISIKNGDDTSKAMGGTPESASGMGGGTGTGDTSKTGTN